MGKIMLNGKQYGVGGIEKAKDISYDNTQSGLSATNVQGALDEIKSGLSAQQTGVGVGITVLATNFFSASKITLYRFGTLIVGSIILQCTANVSGSLDVAQFNDITLPDYYFGISAVTASQWTYDVVKTTRVYFKANGAIGLNTSITSGQYLTIPVCLKTNAIA